MTIAVDKNSYFVANNNNEYIYVFDKENLSDLLDKRMKCIYYKNCDYVDINLTDYDINCLKKASIEDKDYDVLEKKEYKIGIIIPNCNYEHTLNKCLNSILNQTYKNYEIVFVDDASTDNSVAIATQLLGKQHKVIQLQQKRLNGGARNEAYLHLSDDIDYVYYIDSDDWLYDKFSLEKINNKLQKYPDVLFVGMMKCKNGIIEKSYTPEYKDKYQAIEGWSGSCGKVIKKELAIRQDCLYNEGTLKEDKNQHCRICINMKSFEILKDGIYVWNQDNLKSVTTIRTKNILWNTSTIRHYADTMQLFLEQKGKDIKVDKILKKRVDRAKKEMLNGGDKQW